jgi:hypothetical protein
MGLVALSRKKLHRMGFAMTEGNHEGVTANAGLPLLIELLRNLNVDDEARRLLPGPRRQCDYGPDDKLEALMSLIAAGGERVEDIKVLFDDRGLMRLMELEQAISPDALLDFLASFHDEGCWDNRPAEKKAFVPPESANLKALEAINTEMVRRGAAPSSTVATIDHDGTIIEAHKEGAKVAYEGTRGYQPLLATWAEEELIVADEFRDGNVAGGEDPLSSAVRAFANLPPWVTERYYRADSASYYTPLLKYLVAEKIGFCISADMSKQLRARCLALPESAWAAFEKRERKQIDLAEVEFEPEDWSKDAQPLRYVALRFSPLQQELFAEQQEAEVSYHAVVSNRRDQSMVELVRWHRGKAGTIEHVHRVMKDELGAGVMPCKQFGANAAWFRINAMTFNALSVLKRRALPERFRTARPKRLRFEVFSVPGKISTHQSQLTLSLSASSERCKMLMETRERIAALEA